MRLALWLAIPTCTCLLADPTFKTLKEFDDLKFRQSSLMSIKSYDIDSSRLPKPLRTSVYEYVSTKEVFFRVEITTALRKGDVLKYIKIMIPQEFYDHTLKVVPNGTAAARTEVMKAFLPILGLSEADNKTVMTNFAKMEASLAKNEQAESPELEMKASQPGKSPAKLGCSASKQDLRLGLSTILYYRFEQ